jgi:hypothetical protein
MLGEGACVIKGGCNHIHLLVTDETYRASIGLFLLLTCAMRKEKEEKNEDREILS